MIARAVAVWLGLLVLAVVNGAVREVLITPQVGAGAAHVISTMTLCALIIWVAYMSIRWLAPSRQQDLLVLGGMWTAMTLAFEFLAGHYLFGNSWQALLAEYDLPGGRVWVFVPVVSFAAPALAAWARDIAAAGFPPAAPAGLGASSAPEASEANVSGED
jgi:hypothetical protein